MISNEQGKRLHPFWETLIPERREHILWANGLDEDGNPLPESVLNGPSPYRPVPGNKIPKPPKKK